MGISAISANNLAKTTPVEIRQFFGTTRQVPLEEERARLLREVRLLAEQTFSACLVFKIALCAASQLRCGTRLYWHICAATDMRSGSTPSIAWQPVPWLPPVHFIDTFRRQSGLKQLEQPSQSS